jgi:hypothetical protein
MARNLEVAHDELARRFGERTYRLFQMYLWGGAHQMQRDRTLESYRIVFQKSLGSPSTESASNSCEVEGRHGSAGAPRASGLGGPRLGPMSINAR